MIEARLKRIQFLANIELRSIGCRYRVPIGQVCRLTSSATHSIVHQVNRGCYELPIVREVNPGYFELPIVNDLSRVSYSFVEATVAGRRRFLARGMNAKVGQSKGTFDGRRYLKITSDSIRELVDLCHACFAIERSLGNRGIPCITIRGRKLVQSA